MSLTTFNSFIASMNLCPCFLQNEHPKFISVSSCKAWFMMFTRNEVINTNSHLDSIFGKCDLINTILIDLRRTKNARNSSFMFSKYTTRAQEIAISQLPLLDITWRHSICKHLQITFIVCQRWNFGRADPLIVGPFV